MLLSKITWAGCLSGRRNAVLLGILALFAGVELFFIHSDLRLSNLGPAAETALAIVSVAGVWCLFGLTLAMFQFWLRLDPSPKRWRTAWFVILLLGIGYGSQIVYYALVYLPAVWKGRVATAESSSLTDFDVANVKSRRIGPFQQGLLVLWLVPTAMMVALLILPRQAPDAVLAVACCLFVPLSALVVFESLWHAVSSFFRRGLQR